MKTLTKHITIKRSAITLLAIALVLILSATVGTTAGYFTTYATAKGTVPIALEEHTDLTETARDKEKVVVISNSEDGRPVFVRARAYSGTGFELQYTGEGWSLNQADGYYYYSSVVEPGGSTSELTVTIKDFPSGAEDKDNFNIVVVYESTPALYRVETNAAGEKVNVPYADWSSEGGDQ